MSVLSFRECPDVESVSSYALSSSSKRRSHAKLTAGVLGSLALFPLVLVQGMVARRRMPSLPAARPPHRGFVPGAGRCLRILAIGDSTVSGIWVMRGDETVSATTARVLARRTGRPVAWHAVGLSGATAKIALRELMPRLKLEPADLLVVAFGVNDAMAYRSPTAFARDLATVVSAARDCVGDAAVVIAGVAPLKFFPGLPSPLRAILGWRCAALQAAAERLAEQLPRLVVERFSALFVPELFASDGFHSNARAHAMWGEEIAALALPLLRDRQAPYGRPVNNRTNMGHPGSSSRGGRSARSGIR